MTRRTRSSTRTPSLETQATRAFSKLVTTHPIIAAIVLVVVAVGAWLYLRQTSDDPSTNSAASSASAAVQADRSQSAAGTPSAPPQSRASGGTTGSPQRTDSASDSGLPVIAESDLPSEAKDILDAIRNGGPFEFEEDGGVFGNFEGLLPQKPSGYYHEYTVQMPTDSTRGAHRFVVGDGGEIYWTDDHYESFYEVEEGA